MPGTVVAPLLVEPGADEFVEGGDRNPRVRSSAGDVAGAGEFAGAGDGVNVAPGTGIVFIGAEFLRAGCAATPLVLGLAATTAAGALGSEIVVENAGLEAAETGALLPAVGAASTIRIGSSPEPLVAVENDELDEPAVEGVETIGAAVAGVLAGVAEIGLPPSSLRIMPPVLGAALPSGNVTMGGTVLESVGVAAGG
jgi:hypothetical protein